MFSLPAENTVLSMHPFLDLTCRDLQSAHFEQTSNLYLSSNTLPSH